MHVSPNSCMDNLVKMNLDVKRATVQLIHSSCSKMYRVFLSKKTFFRLSKLNSHQISHNFFILPHFLLGSFFRSPPDAIAWERKWSRSITMKNERIKTRRRTIRFLLYIHSCDEIYCEIQIVSLTFHAFLSFTLPLHHTMDITLSDAQNARENGYHPSSHVPNS